MRVAIFRTLAGILGAAFVLVAFPISEYSQSGFWPSWVQVIAFLLLGLVFLVFALTGRTWPRSYGQKIVGVEDGPNDR